MNILLDLIVCNYTHLNSYFFIACLNSKNICYIIYTGLVLDFILIQSYGVITIILVILYFIDKLFKNYYFKNIYNYLFMLSIVSLIFKLNFVNLFLTSFIYQIIYIILIKKSYH